MSAKIKLKYCRIELNDVEPDCPAYATVNFENNSKSDPMALAFHYTMNKRILHNIKTHLLPLFNSKDSNAHEDDSWIIVDGYTEEFKHHVTRLITIVKEAELEFDKMLAIKEPLL